MRNRGKQTFKAPDPAKAVLANLAVIKVVRRRVEKLPLVNIDFAYSIDYFWLSRFVTAKRQNRFFVHTQVVGKYVPIPVFNRCRGLRCVSSPAVLVTESILLEP